MYPIIELPIYLIQRLQQKPKLFKLYTKLLDEFVMSFINDGVLIPSITIVSYEQDCKYYGYKSKSGFWKALNKLKQSGFIRIDKDEISLLGLKIRCY